MTDLSTLLIQAIPFVAPEWKRLYGALLEEELLIKLSQRLLAKEHANFRKAPFFTEEVIPNTQGCFAALTQAVEICKLSNDKAAETLAKAMEETPINELLLLIGQRLTSASITDQRAIPPLQKEVLTASMALYNSHISKAARAWEKHAQRSKESFWGTVNGNPAEKEQKVRALVSYILDHTSWWNVFFHYKHQLVYEVRIPSGHGIRWKKDSLELIGFLEPFWE